jgi:hypothetical protein
LVRTYGFGKFLVNALIFEEEPGEQRESGPDPLFILLSFWCLLVGPQECGRMLIGLTHEPRRKFLRDGRGSFRLSITNALIAHNRISVVLAGENEAKIV